ncbi:MAG TPA: S1-like domain-containing RNA-binding protein [Chthoniobacterales bacterium]|jgi:hypothetical protein
MASIGQRNALQVIREATPGYYLDGENLGEILLPRRYIPENTGPGDYVLVFVHRDSEDRLVATTEIPIARVGEFASLKVVSVNPQVGAFLDWGLAKDLLLPIREQTHRVAVGEELVVYVFLDEQSGRIVASSRLEAHLDLTKADYEEGQQVSLLIAGETALGYKAIVENAHWGLLFKSDIGAALRIGETTSGYVRTIRPDGKLDLSLTQAGYGRVRSLTEQILEELGKNNGRLPVSDSSSPEEIRKRFNTSKKAFKQALGALYRKRVIRLTSDGIELIETTKN